MLNLTSSLTKHWMRRHMAAASLFLLASMLCVQSARSEGPRNQNPRDPDARPQETRPQDPAILQIRVVEGDGAVYALGSRATRGITVQITDETGAPVDGASVSFTLPADGPSGNFAGGGKNEIATTRADGRANAWGMQWNRSPGLVEVRVTANKGQTRAGIVCSQYLSASADAGAKTKIASGSHKWLWIVIGVGGAAGAVLAGAAIVGKSGSSASPAAGVTIGSPTIALGKP